MPCQPLLPCFFASVLKLAGADGRTIWRNDLPDVVGNAPPFTLVGNDVLVGGPFDGTLAGADVARLSSIDGSVLWTANPFSASTGGSAASVNPDCSITLVSGNERALLSADSDVVLWTDLATLPCQGTCYTNGTLQLSDGTVVNVGLQHVR